MVLGLPAAPNCSQDSREPRPQRIVKSIMAAKRSVIAGYLFSTVLLSAPVYSDGHNDSTDPAEQAHVLWKEGAGLHLERDYEGAIEHYRRALKLHPTARTHTYLAWSLSRLGRYRDAVRHCRRAIEMDPYYPNAYNDLGAYLVELGQAGEAIPWLRRALELESYCCPQYSHYQLARAFLLQARVEDARRELVTALSIRSDYKTAWYLLRTIQQLGLKGL